MTQHTDLECSDDIREIEGIVATGFMGTMTFEINGNNIERMNGNKALIGKAEELS